MSPKASTTKTAEAKKTAEETKKTVAEKKATETAAKAAEVKEATVKDAAKEEKTAKKPAAKRSTAKKQEKAGMVPYVVIQYAGRDIIESEVVEKVKEVFVAEGHRASSIKELQIYIKPEDGKAYYVINGGKFDGSIDC